MTRIWVDLATSPQVLFMRPIIAELQRRGHDLLITTRDSTETVPLADRYGLTHRVVGAHGGATLVGKGVAIAQRAAELATLARHSAMALAVSCGSYSQALAAAFLRIPMVTFSDYEGHPGNHITCRVAKRILVPDVFCRANLQHYGASDDKIESYGGIKENVYLADFVPDPRFLEAASIPPHKVIATMRPPSVVSVYHRFDNPLFDELLLWASSRPDALVVLLPRGSKQRAQYEQLELANVLIPRQVMDGPNLIYYSDLVIGAGGTMNREATVLGTPVYTVFKGMLGSVDQHLIRSGKMVRIEDSSDIAKIDFCKKPRSTALSWSHSRGLVSEVVDKMLRVQDRPSPRGT